MVLGDGNITLEIAKIALNKLEIDDLGLDNTDRKILETIIYKYAGKPVGVESLSATLNEEVETIEDVYEPYLMQIGFLARTPRGRIVTEKAYTHLGISYENEEKQLDFHKYQFIIYLIMRIRGGFYGIIKKLYRSINRG